MYFIQKKSKYLKSSYSLKLNSNKIKFFNSFNYFNHFNQKKLQINNKLFYLGNPYGLDLRRYVFIKYILSILLSFAAYFNTHRIFLSALYFIFFYYTPNLLINIYVKNENTNMIYEVQNMCQTLQLCISAQMPIIEALKLVTKVISYPRLKNEFSKFVDNYQSYNFNMAKAQEEIKKKFSFGYINTFLEILEQKNGNITENLEYLSKTLSVLNYKYIRSVQSKNYLKLTFATVISLIDIILIVIYPLFSQIIQNLKLIFV